MTGIRIELHGFDEEEIGELRAFLASKAGIGDVYEVHRLEGSGVHAALTAILSDTTIVAEILKEAAAGAVSITALINVVRSWLTERTKSKNQRFHVEETGSEGNASSGK